MKRFYESLHPFTQRVIFVACFVLAFNVMGDWGYDGPYHHKDMWGVLLASLIIYGVILVFAVINTLLTKLGDRWE